MLRDKDNKFTAIGVQHDKKTLKFAEDDFSTSREGFSKGYNSTAPSLKIESESTYEPSVMIPPKSSMENRRCVQEIDADENFSLFSGWKRERKDSDIMSQAMLEHYLQIKDARVSPFSVQGDVTPDEEEKKDVLRPVARLGQRLPQKPAMTPDNTE